jgi:tetratricopeptide (TPR) repeat protein
LYFQQRRLDEARRELEQYLERQPSAAGVRTLVGIILEMQNRREEAQKQYERALEGNAESAVAANNLAWMYAEQNINLDTALQLSQTAKRLIPDRAEIDDTLGWVYYKKGLASLAVSAFEQSIAKDPSNPSFHYHLGLAYVQAGDKVKARASLQKSLSFNRDFPGASEARRALAGLG